MFVNGPCAVVNTRVTKLLSAHCQRRRQKHIPNTILAMAAVEGAIPMATIPVVPERRGRDLEIIDVDSLDDSLSIPQPPRQRRRLSNHRDHSEPSGFDFRETIVISDGEDEQEQLPASSRRPRRPRSRRKFCARVYSRDVQIRIEGRALPFSPSPPPPAVHPVPPVPPIPPQFGGFQTLPMHRIPPPFPTPNAAPGVVRPVEHPFLFEVDIQPAPQAIPTVVVPPVPAAAPPSHHVPVLGFGGAFISQHTRRFADRLTIATQRANEAREREMANEENIGRRFTNLYRSAIRRISGSFSSGRTRTDYREEDNLFAQFFLAETNNLFFPSLPASVPRPRKDVLDYDPSFTHPPKPAPGFTFDFAPPSSPPSGSSSSSPVSVDDAAIAGSSSGRSDDACNLLVCAQCLDPLVMGDIGEDGQQRLWALRCGHLFDGKCVEKIMKPLDGGNAKGKDVTPAFILDKGKGKATSTTDVDPDSIKSRLRPRHPPAPPDDSFARRLAGPSLAVEQHAFPSHTKPRTRKSKGKRKASEPRVEALHEWHCPVSGCGEKHLSLLLGGKWTMDKDRGAIGVYV